MSRSRSSRGQTLVLFALSMLLLALMVLVTLSLGMKVKEKMEVQTVADAAAYSNAAITARTFNEIGLMNRAQIGHMASMAAVQSAISWASFYRAQVAASVENYDKMIALYQAALTACTSSGCLGPCAPFCACAPGHISQLMASRIPFYQEDQRIQTFWDAKDEAAAAQMRMLQGANSALYATQQVEYWRMHAKLNNQSLAREIVDQVRTSGKWPGEWTVDGSADSVTMREVGPNPLDSAVLLANALNSHHLWTSMGSRGWTFTTTRSTGGAVISARLNLVNQGSRPDVIVATDIGSGYWASSMNHGRLMPSGAFAWADDHGTNTLYNNRGAATCPLPGGVPPPPMVTPVQSTLKSTDELDLTDIHTWSPSLGLMDAIPAFERHKLGLCIPPG